MSQRTSRSLLLVVLAAGCGSSGSVADELDGGGMARVDAAPSGPTVARVVVNHGSLFLAARGASAQLTAVAFDAGGAVISTPITWSSSKPEQISVDPTGAVVAQTLGSAQIFAAAGGVKSLPVIVLAAEPAAGALVIPDDQVVTVETPQSVGAHYDVTFTGLAAAPQPGTVILPAGDKVFGGKVVSSRAEGANLVVTLALAPLYELLARYDYAWSIQLAPFVTPARPTAKAARPEDPPVFQPVKCDAEVEAKLAEHVLALSPTVNLVLEVFGQKPEPDQPPSYTRRAVTGTLTLSGEASLVFKPNISVSGECLAQTRITVPVGGLLALVVMPQIRIGVGAGVEATLVVAEGKVGLTGSISATVAAGVECGGATPDCRAVDSFSTDHRMKPVADIPRLDQMHVEASAQIFAFVGLDALFFLTLSAPIAEGRFGPKQSFDMGNPQDQLTNPDYASSYELALEGVIKPGSALQEAINAIFPGPAAVQFKAKTSVPISHSPRGTLAVDKTITGPQQPVTISVDLADLDYWQLGYNVLEVHIYKKREDEPEFTKLAAIPVSASGGQTHFQHVWTPTEADVGKNELAALVMTQLDPLIPLHEIATDSRKEVEVKCFTTPGPTSRPAATCEDAWTGSATQRITTPGMADSYIETRGSLRWRFVERIPFPPFARYEATGTLSVRMSPPPGCTIDLSPSSFTFPGTSPFDASTFGISTASDPAQYSFLVQSYVDLTTTVECPGEEPVVTPNRGFPLGLSGGGPMRADDVTVHGSFDDGAVSGSWSFSRQ